MSPQRDAEGAVQGAGDGVAGAQVLSGLQHDRIVCLLGACLVPPHVCLVEELVAGSLFARLHQSGEPPQSPLPPPLARVRRPPSSPRASRVS